MRLFLALPVDSPTRDAVGELFPRWKQEIRGCSWVPPQNLHLTVKFLGDVEEEQRADIDAVVHDAVTTISPFTAAPKGGAYFPHTRRARVLFIAYAIPGWLISWIKNLDGELQKLGFPAEKRAFKGHVTVARVRKPIAQDQIECVFSDIADLDLPSMEIRELQLMESHLSPQGARYDILTTYPFGGADA